jgi:hypothetical protein
MKKLSVVMMALSVLFMIMPATAQNRIGIIGGLNLANLSIKGTGEDLNLSNLTAFGVGGVLDLALSQSVSLRFEPMYLQKGAQDEESSSGVNVETKVKLDYLEVPALFKIAFGTGTTQPYLLAGPTMGFLLSAKTTLKASGQGVNIDEEEDIKEFLKSTDFGLNFGAGISFPAGNNAIFVEGRYGLGLTNINDDPDDPDTDVKTKGIQVMGGITFPLGGSN